MKLLFKFIFLLFFFFYSTASFSQKIVSIYNPLKNDSIRIGVGEHDFLPYVQSGFTLMLPEHRAISGVLIFLEDSVYDKKNTSAKQIYNEASEEGYAVLSVSTEIPLDFYFSESSMTSARNIMKEVFSMYNLPNQNIFFLGAGLSGHRAMRYIKLAKQSNQEFKLNIKGIVACNFTMDFVRKWYQHKRDIRLKRINLWEPKFINYMLETYLGGTPETTPERYYEFSSYSYFDKTNRNVELYKEYAVRVYVEPAIEYKLNSQLRTLYENNVTDMVGFLAELELAGNTNTELVVLGPEANPSTKKNTQSTWDAINKSKLMDWIIDQASE